MSSTAVIDLISPYANYFYVIGLSCLIVIVSILIWEKCRRNNNE